MKYSKQDWVIGAAWRYSARRRLPADQVARLLHVRCGLTEAKAKQLTHHWTTCGMWQEAGRTTR